MNKRAIIPFIDLLFCFLLGLICVIMLLNKSVEKDPAFKQNVVYQVVLQWEGNSDLDLWGRDPKGRVVGYNRREGGQGSLFSLNRDCLGSQQTEAYEDGSVATTYNEEVISVRGVFVGEYTINVHAFNLRDAATPVKAKIKLIKVKPYREMIVKERDLNASGDEVTAFRFSSDKDGNITDVNELPTSFIHGDQSQQPQFGTPYGGP